METGARIKFRGDSNVYEMQACDERFGVLTAPKDGKEYYYVLVDMKQRVRGPDDLLFGPRESLNTPDGAEKYLAMLRNDEIGISRRQGMNLLPDEVKALKGLSS